MGGEQQRGWIDWESIAGLMAMAGALAVFGAIPCGIAMGFMDYSKHKDLWSIVFGGLVTVVSAIVGSVLVWIGWNIATRCWSAKDHPTAD